MPRRSVPRAHILYPRRSTRRFFLVCTIAIFFASYLMLPSVVDSAQQRATKKPVAPSQQQKPRKTQKVPAESEEGTSTRGIEVVEVPSFKADTSAHALIIGISSYPNLQPRDQLKFADADAQALHDFLVSEKGGFTEENVTLLLNEEATRDQISRELGRIQNISGPNSLVLVFFAGHGVVNKSGQAFLVASNTKADDLHATGLDMTTVNNTIQSMRARSVVIMTDACHAGAIANTLNAGQVTNLSAKDFAASFQREDQSSFIFSAASPTQSSNEDATLRHGLFTYFLLQGLEGKADTDGDGMVSSQELYRYVDKELKVENQKRNIAQVPEFNPGYDPSIPLAVTNESGRAKYLQWFKDDSLSARYIAQFYEALRENKLTTPAGQSAWDYCDRLDNYVRTPRTVVAEKWSELLKKIESEADALIEERPTDPGKWNAASINLDKAYQRTRDNNLQAKQLFCSMMYDHQTGETGRAENKCDTALDFIEKGGIRNPLLSIRIGQFFKELRKWGQSRRGYRLGIDDKANEIWLTEYAEVLTHLSIFDEAETQLNRALIKNPQHQPALVKLSASLLRDPTKDRLAQALTHITKARQIIPEDLDAEEIFGRVKLEMGETQQAIDSLMKVADLRPPGESRDQALLYLSQSYRRTGDLDRAVSALRDAETSGSRKAEIFEELAELMDERGDVQGSINAAEKAVTYTHDTADKARRLHLVAEYRERGGQLLEAAFGYKNAERAATDAKLRSSWENRAKVLFLRRGRYQDAGVSRSPAVVQQRWMPRESSPVIVPGGRDALARLTGLTTAEADRSVLARVFDACLRDPALGARLINFYSDYPEFARKAVMKGGSLSGMVGLPPPNQVASAEAREALKFFGINDKKGIRQIKSREFESRSYILKALGGDPEKLKNGELVNIAFRDQELPVINGMGWWLSIIKDGLKLKADEQFLAFLKDQRAMKLYVAFSLMPEEAAERFGPAVITKENRSEVPDSLYFAAPYLRFDAYGDLIIPGQRQGEGNWQAVLKTVSKFQLLQSLFEKDNGGALYLFCALSGTGEVGDFLARSSSFEQLFRMFKQADMPKQRESFDFIDLLRQMKVENDQLRLPRVVDEWRRSRGAGDSVMDVLRQIEKVSGSQPILLVKQIAVLNLIERERPAWVADLKIVELIAEQVAANRESLLEVALDIEMTKEQLRDYFALVQQIDALPPSSEKTASVRSFQAIFELFRSIAKNSSLSYARLTELTDQLLKLDPARSDYGLRLAAFLKSQLLNVESATSGAEVEAKLIELLVDAPLIEMPRAQQKDAAGNAKDSAADIALLLPISKSAQRHISKFLASQKHNRLSNVLDALNTLDELDRNPSSVEALAKLKAHIERFVEVERELESKKKKNRKSVVQELTLKETVAQQALPVDRLTAAAIRNQIAPFVGEALLAHVYAVSGAPWLELVPFSSVLITSHDFSIKPWSVTEIDQSGRITGNLVRLNHALALLASSAPTFNGQRSAFVGATLNSFQLVRRRSVSRDAEEFVARTIDLGEDVLALYILGDQPAVIAVNLLNRLMTQRRALSVKLMLDRREMEALKEITPSELYALGRVYLQQRLATTPLRDLISEPGALGALARVLSRNGTDFKNGLPASLRNGINQFGMSTTSRNGLSRLELIELEPYEHAMSFRNDYRLAEEVQDLKLVLARYGHRMGGSAMLALHPIVAQKILSHALAQTRAAAGGTSAPERDWLSLIQAIQRSGEAHFSAAVEESANAGDVQSVARSKWNDRPSSARPDLKPQQ